ncbi:MAG: BspA family leucine-rich repeat surface protein, partial [Flavobacteriaceae bacterium]|nr:BspA family leucine-rich repeat surface protein [Flavobacteriaceae bacterium]
NSIAPTLTTTLTSGPQSQTVTQTNAITQAQYSFSTNYTGPLTAVANNLPPGVSMTFSNNVVTLSGTATTSGTYNYSITGSAGSTNSSVNGTIIVNTHVGITLSNGTCKCPNASAGDTAVISGNTYTVVNNSTIAVQIASGNYNLCTTLVTDMTELFQGKTNFNSDISFWDTSNVTIMYRIFKNATQFNVNISSWDVSSVTNFRAAFYSTAFNQDISGWDVSSATTFRTMFRDTPFNQNIDSWDTSNVTNMQSMFYDTPFNQNINSWSTSNVTTMFNMFASSSFNQNIDSWNTSNVTNMIDMFKQATSFNQDLTGWCVSNISSEPSNFATSSALTNANKPVWGTCPD